MKTVRLALLGVSAMFLAAGGVGVAACSSDDNNGFPTPVTTKDATTGGGGNSGGGSGSDSGGGSGSSDGGTGTGTGTGSKDGSTGTGTSDGGFAEITVDGGDIYACGGPNDCTADQHCYLQAYSDWDGGNFYSSKGTCTLIAADGVSQCKTAAQATASDTVVCGEVDGGAFTYCPSGTQCMPVSVFGKNFGACLTPDTLADGGTYDAGCGSKFIPYADEANYCYGSATGQGDGGCVAPNIICCSRKVGTSSSFTDTCVSDPADCP